MKPAVHAREHDLVGTWKLISASSISSKGEEDDSPYGRNPAGILTYSAEGRVTALLSYGGRKALSAFAKVEDQAEAFKTFLAYTGRYTLRADEIVHHIEIASLQSYVGKDLIRKVRFEDDRIVLTTPPTLVNGKTQTLELTWQRAG